MIKGKRNAPIIGAYNCSVMVTYQLNPFGNIFQ
jgi:hypothetical protein